MIKIEEIQNTSSGTLTNQYNLSVCM